MVGGAGDRSAPEEALAAERTTSGSDTNPITDFGTIAWSERIANATNPTKAGIADRLIFGGAGSDVWGRAADVDGDVGGFC
jgi:hypothetical protein